MHGADMMYSEFISSEGLIRDAIKSRMKLDISDYERPVESKFWSAMKKQWFCLKNCFYRKPDIDINFGCPVKSVCKGAWCFKRC
jgi:tRNA-dihydrouridine synthase